jgi:hypothetical protein
VSGPAAIFVGALCGMIATTIAYFTEPPTASGLVAGWLVAGALFVWALVDER